MREVEAKFLKDACWLVEAEVVAHYDEIVMFYGRQKDFKTLVDRCLLWENLFDKSLDYRIRGRF